MIGLGISISLKFLATLVEEGFTFETAIFEAGVFE